MTDINNVYLVGRLTKDAELNYFGDNIAKLTFTLAVNRSRKSGNDWIDEASFFDCVMFGKMAETIKNYMRKGKQLVFSGHAQQERWEKDGQKHSKIVFVADTVQLIASGEKAPAQENAGFTPNGNNAGFPEDVPF